MGYDVWLANGPGANDYSKHEFLLRNEPAYWDYSPLTKATDFTQTLMYMKRHLRTDDDVLIVAYGNAAVEVIYRYAENSYLLSKISSHVLLLAPCTWMIVEHPHDFQETFWEPIRQLELRYIQGEDWVERKHELCWSDGEYPELCNHQLLNHLSLLDETVPEDFVMNAISANEIGHLLATAKSR